jgi:hypothetical protein
VSVSNGWLFQHAADRPTYTSWQQTETKTLYPDVRAHSPIYLHDVCGHPKWDIPTYILWHPMVCSCSNAFLLADHIHDFLPKQLHIYVFKPGFNHLKRQILFILSGWYKYIQDIGGNSILLFLHSRYIPDFSGLQRV